MPGEHSKFGAPHRPPCGGWPDADKRFFIGPMFNHFRKGDNAVQRWLNVTSVPNPICADSWPGPGARPANVPPYIRPPTTPNNPAFVGRSGYPTDAGYCDGGHPPGTPFAPWLASQLGGCAADDSTHKQVDVNCYSVDPDEFLDLSICRKMGFKNVQAYKIWHGRFGLTSTDGHDCGNPIGGCGEDIPGTADGTKHLTIRVKAVYKREESAGCNFAFNYTLDVTLTVDRLSGVITQAVGEWTHDDPDGIISDFDDTGTVPNVLKDLINAGLGMFCAQTHATDWNPDDVITVVDTTTTVQHLEFTFSNTHCAYLQTFHVTDATVTCIKNGSPASGVDELETRSFEVWLDEDNTYTAADLKQDGKDLLAEWDMADDLRYPFRTDGYTTVAPLVEHDSVPQIVGPQCPGDSLDGKHWYQPGWTDPNAALFTGEVLGKPLPHPGMVAVLQEADIANDTFVARLDADTVQTLRKQEVTIHAGGVVLKDGGGTTLLVGTYPSDYTYDSKNGTIVFPTGSLLLTTHNTGEDPINVTGSTYSIVVTYSYAAIFGGHFDRRHVTWHYSDDLHGPEGVFGPYVFGYGAWSGYGYGNYDPTDNAVPRCATHWTDQQLAQILPHGAFMLYTGSALIAQKWCEVKLPRPSQNFFGPCGAQRNQMDAAKSSCVQSDDGGGSPVLTVSTGEGVRFAAGKKVIYWNGTGSAIYTVSSVSGDDVHLSAKVADANTTFTGGAVLGVLKWPDAWGICGRVAVASATASGGTVTVTTQSPTFLQTGDSVDFTNEPDTVTDGNKTITVIDDSTFTFAGSVPTGAWIKSHGAPPYWYNDTNPKGDYVVLEWTLNTRDFTADDTVRSHQADHGLQRNVAAFSATPDCLPFSPCCPQVICYSPNFDEDDPDSVDVFINGAIYDFGDMTPDERFPYSVDGNGGSAWQGVVMQTMDELFFTPPRVPCSNPDDPFGDYSACRMVEDVDAICPPEDTCSGVGDPGVFYYPHRPAVEARISVPTWSGSGSAPTLPAGIFINYLSLSDLDTAGTPPDGLVHNPPVPVGGQNDPLDQPNVASYETAPWRFYVAQQFCVCNDGRFADDYVADWVICGLMPEP